MSVIQLPVKIEISEPWEFEDENGSGAFGGHVIAVTSAGNPLVKITGGARFKLREWHFAILSTRFVDQRGFESGAREAANILLVADEQAASQEWLEGFTSKRIPDTPWLVGVVSIGQAADS